jgi:hypothetical protein
MHGASIGNRTLWGHRLASTYAEFEAVAHRPSGGDGGEGGGDDSQSRQGQADSSPPPQVSLDGFRQALRQLDIPLTQAQAAEIFAAMDLDQDGWLECAHRACLLFSLFWFPCQRERRTECCRELPELLANQSITHSSTGFA